MTSLRMTFSNAAQAASCRMIENELFDILDRHFSPEGLGPDGAEAWICSGINLRYRVTFGHSDFAEYDTLDEAYAGLRRATIKSA